MNIHRFDISWIINFCRVGTPDSDPQYQTPTCLTCNYPDECRYITSSFSSTGLYYFVNCRGPEIPTYTLKSLVPGEESKSWSIWTILCFHYIAFYKFLYGHQTIPEDEMTSYSRGRSNGQLNLLLLVWTYMTMLYQWAQDHIARCLWFHKETNLIRCPL